MVNMEWKDFETEMLQDPEIRKEYDALKPKYDKIQREIVAIKVPKHCLICGSEYAGGHAWIGESMEEGLRVFFHCGASMSVKVLSEDVYQILFKNCCAKGSSKHGG